jgi:catechol 2,3-dioxygenase-like lactoylglutathione lyase family enzyme
VRKGGTLAVALLGAALTAAAPPPGRPPVAGGALRVGGIDHVGINVPDAAAAAAFFHELMGTRIVSDMRPGPVSSAWKARFRWHSSTTIRRLMMLEATDGSKIELFEYVAPQASREQPHEDDAGATHIALKVQDVDRSIAVVNRHKLRILNDPVTLPDGSRWFYFLTPWGSQLELVFPAQG